MIKNDRTIYNDGKSYIVTGIDLNGNYKQSSSFPSSKRRYVIERNTEHLDQLLEPSKSNFRLSKSLDRSGNKSTKQRRAIVTRLFHYIVAPPIIKELQEKQYEEETDDDKELQIDYFEATIKFARRLFAEILGTVLFMLVFGSCALEVGEKRLSRESAAFALRSVFPWVWISFYFLTQFLGSIAGTLFLKLLFRDSDVSFVLNSPRIPIMDAFIWESFLTCCMIFVILQTATKGQIIGPQAALALASILIFIGLTGAEKSSVSLNPFRSIGPAIFIRSHKNKDIWLFIVAPLVGTIVALFISGLLQGFKPKSTSELKAAQGNEMKIMTK